MGIGFIVFGYLFFSDFFLSASSGAMRVDMLPNVVAWVFLFWGTHRAAPWSRYLRVASIIALCMILPSGFSVAYDLGVYSMLFSEQFYPYVYPLLSVSVGLVFHYFLLFGLRQIADSCHNEGVLSSRLARNFYLTFFCFCLIFFAQLVQQISGGILPYTQLVTTFCTMIYLIFNELVFVRFFRRITLG